VSRKAVYVHIGLPKTGTTYIQSSLWESRSGLASAGCLVPGETRVAKWRAVSDLLGRRPQGAEAQDIDGSWNAFTEVIRDWHGDRVVFSEELLVTAGRRQVQQLVRSLSPAEVHAVVTVRDLARMLPSAWQQEVKKGRTWQFDEFVSAVREPGSGPPTAAAAYWLRFDVPRILQTWERAIPAANVHVVILPPSGAPASVLLERFADVVGVDADALEAAPREQANAALGLAEVEVLRRLNVGLAGQLNERQYARAVVQSVVPLLQDRATSGRLALPVEHRAWATEQSAHLVEFLKTSPYDVVGPLDDLVPPPVSPGASQRDDLDEAQLVEPLTAALTEVCSKYARYWWQVRRPESVLTSDSSVRLASSARALRYKAKARILQPADTNKMVGRVARAYLKRRSSRP